MLLSGRGQSDNFQTDTVERGRLQGSHLSTCSRWYAIRTLSRHEKSVNLALTQTGIESFLPLHSILSQWKDRRKRVEKPLFPGYLFVRSRRTELYRVNDTRGVAYVLGNGRGAVPIPEEQVEALRQMVEGPDPVVPWPFLQTGKPVHVTLGPLAGIEGYITEVKRGTNCRLVVSLHLLGCSVAVEIDPSWVEPVH
ncbi:MAG: UpxY family transcription antiterminator [Planctomycetia bacterium]|nr:UpxY family transcription antiterminator [Planctomycetia bacterium]